LFDNPHADGIEGEQKILPAAQRAGQSSRTQRGDGLGDRKPYLQFDRVEGPDRGGPGWALELHRGIGEPFQPEQPGRLVFDLDPAPDVAFEAVIAAAERIRDRLDALVSSAFARTTGGKGCTWLRRSVRRARTGPPQGVARDVCKAMAADAPERY